MKTKTQMKAIKKMIWTNQMKPKVIKALTDKSPELN